MLDKIADILFALTFLYLGIAAMLVFLAMTVDGELMAYAGGLAAFGMLSFCVGMILAIIGRE